MAISVRNSDDKSEDAESFAEAAAWAKDFGEDLAENREFLGVMCKLDGARRGTNPDHGYQWMRVLYIDMPTLTEAVIVFRSPKWNGDGELGYTRVSTGVAAA